jgi:hypothetical protein
LLLGLLFGLAGMGSSSAAIALPLMGQDLGVDIGTATWTISLFSAVVVPADRGHERTTTGWPVAAAGSTPQA